MALVENAMLFTVVNATGWCVVIALDQTASTGGLSDAVWLAIIGVFAMAIKEYFDRARSAAADKKIEDKAAETKAALELVKTDVGKVEATAAIVVTKVEEIHKLTNSLTDRLMEKTEGEALARGSLEERARADERKLVAKAAAASTTTSTEITPTTPVLAVEAEKVDIAADNVEIKEAVKKAVKEAVEEAIPPTDHDSSKEKKER